jgi:hypothetical protein
LKIATILFAAATMFSVCADAQQMTNYDYKQRDAAFWEYAKGILLECKQQKDRGQIRSFVALVKCSNQSLAEAWSWYKLGFDDLAALFLARRLEIAERIGRGALTEAQGQIEGIQAYQQLLAIAQERQRTAQATAQANAAAVS